MAPWRTNLIKNSWVLEPKTQSSYSLRKQSLVFSVNVCYRYRGLVISSLMTIYLVFCKSKAKYHMLFRPLIRQAPGKQQRLPNLGAVESREGCGLWLHCSLKYLIYDNTPAKLLISGGKAQQLKLRGGRTCRIPRAKWGPTLHFFSQKLGKRKSQTLYFFRHQYTGHKVSKLRSLLSRE